MNVLIDVHQLPIPIGRWVWEIKNDKMLDEICCSLSNLAGFCIHGVRWADPEDTNIETAFKLIATSANPDDLVMFVLKWSK